MIPSDANTLIASLIWGAIGLGMFVYGKKQEVTAPLIGGLPVIGVSYFVESPLYMSLASIAIIAAAFYLSRRN